MTSLSTGSISLLRTRWRSSDTRPGCQLSDSPAPKHTNPAASTASAATDPPKRPTRRNWYSASATSPKAPSPKAPSPKAPSPKASLPYQTSSPTRVNMRSASGSRPGSLAKRCTPTPKPTSGSDSHWRWKRLARSHRGSPVGTGRCIGDSEAVGLFLWGSGGVRISREEGGDPPRFRVRITGGTA